MNRSTSGLTSKFVLAVAALLLPASLSANQPIEVKVAYPEIVWDYHMGYAVAMSGDTALIAVADGNPQPGSSQPAFFGSILSFRRAANGWALEQEFGPLPNPGFPDYVGSTMDIDGDFAVVGAEMRQSGIGGVTPNGATLYERINNVWTERASLSTGDDDQDRAFEFGTSVAIDGNIIAVGTPEADPNGYPSGAVYIFEIGAEDVTLQATLIGDDTHIFDIVGTAVALNGDTVAFYGEPNDGPAIYVFVRNPDGIWSQQAKLRPPAQDLGPLQLKSVALSGDTLVSGTRPTGSTHKNGAVFVWERSGDVWTLTQSVRPDPEGIVYEGFGDSVDLHDDTMIVGAPGAQFHPSFRQTAYIFERDAGVWQQRSVLQPSDSTVSDRFGLSVATNGTEFVVGAENQWNLASGNARETGGAYIYGGLIGSDDDGDGVINDLDACVNIGSGLPVDCEGRPRRDVNGDCSVDTFDIDGIVSALLSEGQQINSLAESFDYPVGRYQINPRSLTTNGEVVAFSGGVDGSTANRVILLSKVNGEWQEIQQIQSNSFDSSEFGIDLDIDGDTLMVGGAISDSDGQMLRSIEVYERSGQSWTLVDRLFASDGEAGNGFGDALDLDGDTLIVGAPYAQNNQGRAYIFERVDGTWTETRMLVPAAISNARFGKAVATDGDVSAVLGRTPGTTPSGDGREIGGYVFERIGNTWSTGEVLVCQLGGNSQSATVVSVDDGRIVIDRSFKHYYLVFTKTMDGWEVTSSMRSLLMNFYASAISPDAIAMEGNQIYVPNSGYPAFPDGAPIETHVNNIPTTSGAVEVFDLEQAGGVAATLVPQRGFPERVRIGMDVAVGDGLLVSYTIPIVGTAVSTCSFYMIQTAAVDDGDGVKFDRDECALQSNLLLSDCNGRPLYDVNEDCRVDGCDLAGIVTEILGG